MSKKMNIDFIKLHGDAKLPQRNNPCPITGDVGYDLFAVEDTMIPAGGSRIVPVGLQLGNITPGYWFRIEARSGLGFKKGLQPHFGVIDNPYRGPLGIKVYNLSDDHQTISKGQGCAQFIVFEMIEAECGWTDVATETSRGANGFGSSDGKKN